MTVRHMPVQNDKCRYLLALCVTLVLIFCQGPTSSMPYVLSIRRRLSSFLVAILTSVIVVSVSVHRLPDDT